MLLMFGSSMHLVGVSQMPSVCNHTKHGGFWLVHLAGRRARMIAKCCSCSKTWVLYPCADLHHKRCQCACDHEAFCLLQTTDQWQCMYAWAYFYAVLQTMDMTVAELHHAVSCHPSTAPTQPASSHPIQEVTFPAIRIPAAKGISKKVQMGLVKSKPQGLNIVT